VNRIFSGRKLRVESAAVLSGAEENSASIGEPATQQPGIPIGVYAGRVPNPHIFYGQDDLETGPVTFARYNMARGVHDVQLSNGWQNTAYGLICNYRNEGYLSEVVPVVPGQSRLYGSYGPPAGFVPRGNAPAQWQNIVNAVQQQPSNPAGPGQSMGPIASTGAGG
jgi:hypothetical protein